MQGNPASITNPGLVCTSLDLAMHWYQNAADPALPEWSAIDTLIRAGQLMADATPDGLVLAEPQYFNDHRHAEWLLVYAPDRKRFAKTQLKGWSDRHGFNSVHWPLPQEAPDPTLPAWAWVLPGAGYTLTAQASLTLNLDNPLSQVVYQQRQTQMGDKPHLAYRWWPDLSPDHPLWVQVAHVLQQAYKTSRDMDWHPTFSQDPLGVLIPYIQQVGQASVLAAYDGHTLAGVCICHITPPLADVAFWAVMPPYHGIGVNVLGQALRHMAPTVNRVQACTHTRLNKVIKAYQSFGFELNNWQVIAY